MRTNRPAAAIAVGTPTTFEGAPSTAHLTPLQQLERSVLACLLFEDTFYEDGQTVADRISQLAGQVTFDELAALALKARGAYKLRHIPLLLTREAIRRHKGRQVGDLIAAVIQRPDELGELLALYWAEKADAPLTAQMKVGLARALKSFNPYQLAKYNRADKVRLRDVMFLSHPRARDAAQGAIFKALADDTLDVPDTWEVALSAGADKRATFERLISERKLGALALLRNLRGMLEVGVSEQLMRDALAAMDVSRVLPFRFVTAAKHAPRLEDALEQALFRCVAGQPKLPGKTALLIDHSASMGGLVSAKSEVTRFDAAGALAMVLREKCDAVRTFTFSSDCREVPPRRGFALLQAVREYINPQSTLLGAAVRHIYSVYPDCERLIVVTDEQSHDRPPHPQGAGYIVNVAPHAHGIGYGPWTTISGWSEAVVQWIMATEGHALTLANDGGEAPNDLP